MKRKENFTVGFIGLGLIGGSIAKNIRRIYPNYQIIGYDIDAQTVTNALFEGTLTVAAKAVDDTFGSCDYIFL